MTRPYTTDGAVYRVATSPHGSYYTCDTRAHAGLYYTRRRSQHGVARSINAPTGPVERLAVAGTTDELAKRGRFGTISEQKPCPCCGAKGKGRYVLSPTGRRLLARHRAARAHA